MIGLVITICYLKLGVAMADELATLAGESDAAPIPIVDVRGQPVVLSNDLAAFFGVETGPFNQQVKRNIERFHGDWCFQLTEAEFTSLKSQNVISSGWGGVRYPPWAFTEHGLVMAATVTNSPMAVRASRVIVEAFVAYRQRHRRESNALVPVAPASTLPAPLSQALAVTREKVAQLLAAEINPKAGTSVADEAEDLIDRGFKSLKAFLDKGGLDNEETKARIMKTIAEAHEAKARTETQHELTERQRIKNLANRLRLLIAAERAVNQQGMAEFLAVLDDLGKDA